MKSSELEEISHLYYEMGNLRLALKKQGLSDSQIYKKSKVLMKNPDFQAILEKDARQYIDSNIAGVLKVLSGIIYNEDANEKTRLAAINTFLDRSRLHKTEKTEIEVINSPTEIISDIYKQIEQRRQNKENQVIDITPESTPMFIENKETPNN